MSNKIVFLAKIIKYTKKVNRTSYEYMEIRIMNNEALKNEFKAGQWVSVKLEKIEGLR